MVHRKTTRKRVFSSITIYASNAYEMICQYIKYLFGPPSLISDDSNSFQRKIFHRFNRTHYEICAQHFRLFLTFCFLRATEKNLKKLVFLFHCSGLNERLLILGKTSLLCFSQWMNTRWSIEKYRIHHTEIDHHFDFGSPFAS